MKGQPSLDRGNIRILSLGAGTQSSALALMYENGELPNPPDYAIFADTEAEPPEVTKWLKKLQTQITKFPILTRSRGNLVEDTLSEGRSSAIPFFMLNPDGSKGMGKRQCTADYKINVVYKAIREILGYKPRQKMRHTVDMIMGISIDEPDRIALPRQRWQRNEYPLIDKKIDRKQCIEYVERLGLGTPPRSACFMCPFRSNKEWGEMKKTNPELFERACQYDEAIRVTRGFKATQFVHSSRTPLRNVKLDNDSMDYFANECQGMCGL